jgi:hypothetical protein
MWVIHSITLLVIPWKRVFVVCILLYLRVIQEILTSHILIVGHLQTNLFIVMRKSAVTTELAFTLEEELASNCLVVLKLLRLIAIEIVVV